MRPFALLFGTLTVAAAATAQQAPPTPEAAPTPHTVRYRSAHWDDEGDRAALGIMTQATGKRDTLGLLVAMVTAGSPADKAGITEGDRLAAIDGTSLKVSPADAGESDMRGVMTNRLIRQLRKVKVGDDVTLSVLSGGSVRTVKVKTVAMDEIGTKRHHDGDRAAVGISFGGGSVRDTLGLFVQNVTVGGPADKAGIEEGNRVAAINGVDLRIPAADAGEGALVWAKQSRLIRVLSALKPGDAVELKVYAGGSYRTVKVTTVKASELFGEHSGNGYGFSFGDMSDMPMVEAMPPIPPMPPMAPMAPMHFKIETDDEDQPVTVTCSTTEDANVRCKSSGDALRKVRAASMAFARAPHAFGGMHAMADGDAEFTFPGLRLTSVTAELASYFGAGSEKGLLVLEASAAWSPLKAGDVVLTHNGRTVQRDGGSYLSISTDTDNTFGVLRKGKALTVTVKGR